VVLFNNTVYYDKNNDKWVWAGGTPERCELFRPATNYFQDPDLEDNLIGQCDPYGVLFWGNAPCASAIAIYPLK